MEPERANGLSGSLTSMDWLQKLNAEYVTSCTVTAAFTTSQSAVRDQPEPILNRPSYNKTLVQWAIDQSPLKCATFHEICQRIEAQFHIYTTNSKNWKVFAGNIISRISNLRFFSRPTFLTHSSWTHRSLGPLPISLIAIAFGPPKSTKGNQWWKYLSFDGCQTPIQAMQKCI